MDELRIKMTAYRAAHNITLVELAKLCDLNYVTVARVESGKQKPSRLTAAKILAVVNKK